MPAFNTRRFTEPKVLRGIERHRFIQFLRRFEDYLSRCGATIPDPDGEEEIDYDRLSTVLASPAHDPPLELVDALYLLADLSTDEGLNALLEAVSGMDIDMSGDDHTPADVALTVWLANPTLLEQQQARQYVHRPRSFDYFPMRAADQAVPQCGEPSPKVLREMEKQLAEWFMQKKRGDRCEVRAFPESDRILFLVKHGEPLRREEVDNQTHPSLLYRPMKYDVVVYEKTLGELSLHAATVGEKKLYCRVFGEHLVGDPEFFGEADKHTLDPLRVDGEGSLKCDDIPGIDEIRLVEVHYLWPGDPIETEVRKSKDIFKGLRNRGKSMPQRPKIIKAVFEIKFSDSTNTRRVKLTPHNATFRRDDDRGCVTHWLTERGFVVVRTNGAAHGRQGSMVEAKPILVGAEQPQ
jgi:hypothetical protein